MYIQDCMCVSLQTSVIALFRILFCSCSLLGVVLQKAGDKFIKYVLHNSGYHRSDFTVTIFLVTKCTNKLHLQYEFSFTNSNMASAHTELSYV